MTLAALREARERIGWSQAEAAARSGWSRAAIQLYEAGVHPPPAELARYLAAVADAIARVPRPRRDNDVYEP